MARLEDIIWDTVVIGAGIVGSFTAWQLQKLQSQVLLVDQFQLPHSRGSSAGLTRAVRKAYQEDFYCEMMEEAYKIWEQIEHEANVIINKKTGMLIIDKDAGNLTSIKSNLQQLIFPCTTLTEEELRTKFPGLKFDGHAGLIDIDAGVTDVQAALRTVQFLFRKNGGTICPETKVLKINPGRLVGIMTNKGNYQAKSVVITAGPWAAKLMEPLGLHLPLKPMAINVFYWKEKVPGAYSMASGFPVFADYNTMRLDTFVYGLPSSEYPNMMKMCLHVGPATDPDKRDLQIKEHIASDIKKLSEYIRGHFLHLEDNPSIIERCMYTNTPDGNFILDKHPKWDNIVIGAGFSGHGFKLAPVVGKILADVVTNRNPQYNMTHFRMSRFEHEEKSKL
ncbi:peroxisomal sarcosine oxidase isoform X1 [Lingula anatina]|uniref:Peroxisomal sarcosine oxidase isoform X1 n=2 Tax=Lingula anatina TaxID=7574 RepID=A0A1S3KHS0_LINAN|nr:peroxisomal sarcosine oxidase isoform X1 [Lingula anatina]|eukprot:XP_013421771.1 peroxisomal sarcosine oxidase isoform X1 [Lingula anatina]